MVSDKIAMKLSISFLVNFCSLYNALNLSVSYSMLVMAVNTIPTGVLISWATALQDVKLSNGEYLIKGNKGNKGTGFPYFDEAIAGVKKAVPYNLEEHLKNRGMNFSKAFFL